MAAAASLLLVAACERRPMYGTLVDPPIDIPALEFTTANGAPVLVGGPTAGPTLVFFGYTHCPDICPTTLSDWRRIAARLGEDAARVRFVFISVDRERDTPEVAARYAAGFSPAFIGVSADSLTLARAQAAFMVTSTSQAMPETNGGASGAGHLVMHAGQQFLLDARGNLIAIYSSGSHWDAMAADLDRVL